MPAATFTVAIQFNVNSHGLVMVFRVLGGMSQTLFLTFTRLVDTSIECYPSGSQV